MNFKKLKRSVNFCKFVPYNEIIKYYKDKDAVDSFIKKMNYTKVKFNKSEFASIFHNKDGKLYALDMNFVLQKMNIDDYIVYLDERKIKLLKLIKKCQKKIKIK